MNGVDDMIDRMLATRAESERFPNLRHFGYARFNPALDDVVEAGAARGVCVRDANTGELLVAGAQGELEISGPSLMCEYFGAPDATRAAFTADGFLRTGDLTYLEADGRFSDVARLRSC